MSDCRHSACRGAAPVRRSICIFLLAVLVLAALVPAGASAAVGRGRSDGDPPVFAYYYIWFNPTSWDRAKTDYPLVGRYSSDEIAVMRRHVRWAKRVGIDGFTVSWKSTETLDRRLGKLISVAEQEHFKLAIIYQGLDFDRQPLPVSRVASDLRFFSARYGDRKAFRFSGKPLVIWSGTWRFSKSDIASVTGPLRERLRLLASERNAADYEQKADLFDGDAYYWSSINPDTFPGYEDKLSGMAAAVHRHGGLWVAPAAPGFDARLIGGTTVVDRKQGETLRREYNAAVSSSPDIVGLISWNEFTENSHMEPSRTYSDRYLRVLADIRGAPTPVVRVDPDSSSPGHGGDGLSAPLVAVVAAAFVVGVVLVRRRRSAARIGPPGRRDRPRRLG